MCGCNFSFLLPLCWAPFTLLRWGGPWHGFKTLLISLETNSEIGHPFWGRLLSSDTR